MGGKRAPKRVLSAVILGLFVAFVAVGLNASPAQAAVTTSALRGLGSNRCLDPGTPTNGVQLRIQDCAVGNANQQHMYTSTEELRVGDKCLVARSNGTTSGTPVDTNVCDGTAGQRWTFQANGSVTNQLSGLCLDVSGAATAAGSVIQLWSCHGGSGQSWIRGTTLTIVGQSSGRCLDDRGNPSNGIQQKIFDCLGIANQTYMYTYGQQIRIATRCLMASGSGITAGTPVVTYDCDGSSAQRWLFHANGTITNELSGLCVQTTGGSNATNTLLLLSSCNDANYQKWNRIGRATQTISFTPPAIATLGAGPVALSATATSELPVVLTSGTASVCTLSGLTLTVVSDGTCTVSVAQAGDSTWAPATVSASIAVKVPQSITFALPTAVGLAEANLALNGVADSGLPVGYTSSTTAVCTVAGSTASLLTAGTCTINAVQVGDSRFLPAATVSASIAVKVPQSITFALPTTVGLSVASLALNGVADSGLPVGYTSRTTAVCTVAGSALTLVAAGVCTVDADQAGDATRWPATTAAASTSIIPPVSVPSEPAPVNLRSDGIGVAPQQVTVALSANMTVALLAGHEEVRTVVIGGEGQYVLATDTGVITFTPELGYTGVGEGVAYQVADSHNQRGAARYIPTVTAPPAPRPHTLTSAGHLRAQVMVDLGESQQVTLLDIANQPVLTLDIPDEGRYTLAPATGLLSFVPVRGFIGAATGVRFRVSDAYAQAGEAMFIPTVTAPPPAPPTGPTPPTPPLPKIERSRYAPVPANPKSVVGRERKTKAFNSSFTGIDAHPIPALGTRLLVRGTATSLSGGYAFDSANLKASGRAKVRSVVRNLAGAKAVTCEGYADYGDYGTSRAHEIDLSVRRAKAVCTALKAFGANVTTTSRGYGPQRPAVVGGTQKGRTENRRVVILITR